MEPVAPEHLPLIMKAINWYSAMCFNRLLNRTGHFWEARYHAASFPGSDHQRVLNVLRYIHANPKAAGLRQGYVYAYSNFGIYDRLTDDGLTQWHPAFLGLGATLDTCCNRYRRFCLILRPKRKSARRSAWGRRLLVGIPKQQRHRRDAGGQLSLFDDPERCQAPPGLFTVARAFTAANGGGRTVAASDETPPRLRLAPSPEKC